MNDVKNNHLLQYTKKENIFKYIQFFVCDVMIQYRSKK